MGQRATLLSFGLIALVAGVYFRLTEAQFVYWDDRALFTVNPRVLEFDLVAIFSNLHLGGYFPFTLLSLAVDHLLFGVDPRAMHIENILFHAINTGLVWLAARRIFSASETQAWIIAALFAAHPLNTEAVAWVSGGRKDLLCTAFYLGTLLAMPLSGVASFLFGLAAMLSKAPAVTLPVVMMIVERVRGGGRPKWPALALVPCALAFTVVENLAQRTNQHVTSTGFTLQDSVINGGRGLLFSVSRTLLPRNLAVFYDPGIFRFDAVDYALAVCFVVFAFAAIKKSRRLWFPLVLFFVMVSPVLKLIPFGQDSVFNDRYLYLPGVAMLSFLVLGLGELVQRKIWLPSAAVASLALAFQAHAVTLSWMSQETLWLNVLRAYPQTIKAHQNLSLYYIETGRYEEAAVEMKEVITRLPQDLESWSNLGVLYTRMGRLDDAEKTFLSALQLWPENAMLFNNLGYVFLEQGRGPEAERAFQGALSSAPQMENALQGLKKAKQMR